MHLTRGTHHIPHSAASRSGPRIRCNKNNWASSPQKVHMLRHDMVQRGRGYKSAKLHHSLLERNSPAPRSSVLVDAAKNRLAGMAVPIRSAELKLNPSLLTAQARDARCAFAQSDMPRMTRRRSHDKRNSKLPLKKHAFWQTLWSSWCEERSLVGLDWQCSVSIHGQCSACLPSEGGCQPCAGRAWGARALLRHDVPQPVTSETSSAESS